MIINTINLIYFINLFPFLLLYTEMIINIINLFSSSYMVKYTDAFRTPYNFPFPLHVALSFPMAYAQLSSVHFSQACFFPYSFLLLLPGHKHI